MGLKVFLQIFRHQPQRDSMDGVPSIVGWLILLFFLYLAFRVWREIEKDKKGKINE